MNEFKPGTYKGTVCGMDSGAVGQNGTLCAKILFNVPEINKKVAWTGWFSDKVNEKTGKTYTELLLEKLLELGFTGNCVSEMSDPSKKVENLFNVDKEWDLEIDFQVDRDGVVTSYLEVRWINDPERSFNSKLDHTKAVEGFRGMNIKGELMRLRSQMKPKTTKAPLSTNAPEINEEDIPF